MNRCNVSVIVTTYNPVKNKLISTLSSVINQENVSIEILVADDGSEIDYFESITEYFEKHQYYNYKFIKNRKNVGTVKNIYKALLNSTGEYIYTISPGDMLYDSKTLSNLYEFAIRNRARVCFGNAIYYNAVANNLDVIGICTSAPERPWLFNKGNGVDITIAFFTGNFILGAAFFREAGVFLSYLKRIKNLCKYVEDNTTAALMVADGVDIYHYDNFIIWYEYGSGVSTSKNKEWELLLKKDFDACFEYMYSFYTKDMVLRKLLRMKKLDSKLQKIVFLFLQAPNVLWKIIKIKLSKKVVGNSQKYNKNLLELYLNNGVMDNASN